MYQQTYFITIIYNIIHFHISHFSILTRIKVCIINLIFRNIFMIYFKL